MMTSPSSPAYSEFKPWVYRSPPRRRDDSDSWSLEAFDGKDPLPVVGPEEGYVLGEHELAPIPYALHVDGFAHYNMKAMHDHRKEIPNAVNDLSTWVAFPQGHCLTAASQFSTSPGLPPFSVLQSSPQPPRPSADRALVPPHLNRAQKSVRFDPYIRECYDRRTLELSPGINSPTARWAVEPSDTQAPSGTSATHGSRIDLRDIDPQCIPTGDSFFDAVESIITHRLLSRNDSLDRSLSNALRIHMVQICSTKGLYKRMLSLEGLRAQTWLDALQTLLDNKSFSSNPSETRGAFLKALLRLSDKTGLCPKALQLSHQVRKGEEPVDEGSFGEVYQGRIASRRVALKVFRVNQRTDMSKLMKTIWREAIIWCQLYHANVLPCYGIHRLPKQPNRIGLVSPWMECGNVGDYLRNSPSSDRLLLLSDIASGLSYLHENKIVHGDLKGPNILVSTSGRACLADFGLSRLADPALLGWTSIRTGTAKSTGTIRWQAPELLDPDDETNPRTTTASDIYSYGCVCYEIMTGNVPFHTIKNHYSIPMLAVAGKRPPQPDPTDPAYEEYGLTEPIWSFIEASWKQDPDSRPTASELQRNEIFSLLVDHRPTQDWGETSAAEFRRWGVPS